MFKKNMKNGTVSTSSVPSSDLYGIIKACGDAGVTKLKFGDVYLEFAGAAKPEAKNTVTPPPAAEIAVQEEKSNLQDEQKIKQDQLENMLLEDPEMYETLLMQGDLVDAADKRV